MPMVLSTSAVSMRGSNMCSMPSYTPRSIGSASPPSLQRERERLLQIGIVIEAQALADSARNSMMCLHLRVVEVGEQCGIAEDQIVDMLMRIGRAEIRAAATLELHRILGAGLMTRPRAMIGMSSSRSSGFSRDKFHELVIGLLRAGTGDLVVAAFAFGEAADGLGSARATPAAGAILLPMHRDFVAGDKAAPVGGRDRIDQRQTALLHAFARHRLAVRVHQQRHRVGQEMEEAGIAQRRIADAFRKAVLVTELVDAEEVLSPDLPSRLAHPCNPSCRRRRS